jgi:hydrogenase maturation protease
MTAERVTIMGIGNPLMRDEGVGIRVIEVLMTGFAFPDNVTLVDAGTMGMGILNLFRECDYMLVVDAVDGTGLEPGTVVRLTPEGIAPNQVMHSLHDVRLVDVLQSAQLIGVQPDVDCVGIQIAEMGELAIGLTPAVEAAVPAAVEAALAVLAERGVTPTQRPDSEAGSDAQVLAAIRCHSEGPRGNVAERMTDGG